MYICSMENNLYICLHPFPDCRCARSRLVIVCAVMYVAMLCLSNEYLRIYMHVVGEGATASTAMITVDFYCCIKDWATK